MMRVGIIGFGFMGRMHHRCWRALPDVRIVLEDAPPESFTPHIGADSYCFQVEAVGAYRIQHGAAIQVAVQPQAGMREVRLFLLGTAWGVLCYQRGILALHASVVEVAGESIAFCGVSGAGKSTMAAWLMDQGYPLIADECAASTFPARGPASIPRRRASSSGATP